MAPTTTARPAATRMSRVALGSFAGALMEWYDFFVFGTASALVFGRLFFPGGDPAIGTLSAFATFGVGFAARPVGGIVWGHVGDRVGRKKTLIATLAIVGSCTFLIGLLPTHAQAGVLAPVLLVVLRLLQGFGLGGEYGGAALLTVEHAPADRRGFWGAVPQAAASCGIMLATGAFALVSRLPAAQLDAWGWRLPFLLSLVLLLVGLFIRFRVAETPVFEDVRATDRIARVPLVEVFRTQPSVVARTFGARLAEAVSSNVGNAFAISYVTTTLAVEGSVPLDGILVGSGLGIVVTPLFGALTDRLGRRPVYLAGAAFVVLAAFPFFLLLDTRSTALVGLALVAMYVFGPTLMFAGQSTYFTELYGTNVRYTGLSLAYQLSAVVGGLVPLLAAWLLQVAGGRPWLVAGLLVVAGVVTFCCVLASPETRPARRAVPA